MKVIAPAGAIALFVAALAVPAAADYQKPMGLSVRAGLFWTGSGYAQSFEGNRWFTFGAEYKLGDLSFANKNNKYSASYSISVDYYGKGGFSNTPVLLNYIGRTESFYYSAGAGLGFGKVFGGGSGNSNGDFAYQISAGYDITRFSLPAFVEVRYFGSTRSELNGFALVGGVRF
ncbi:MAG: hypothetical protein MUC92_08170 [Fimbriimonadaceae bacterium]|jgi:hypothetical protein|nr:hypothetical protein [Fimbriimonadaceae bacterium]